MAFVIDTNVVLEWLLGEPPTEVGRAAEARGRREALHGPMQLWAELHTGLLKRERAGVITEVQRSAVAATADAFSIRLHVPSEADHASILDLAASRGLTVYDAFFLDVAIREGLSLATNDAALRRAAQAEGVALV